MSPCQKNNKMKSTLKIDYLSRSDSSIPVIKIIQPNEVFEDSQTVDYDVRDKLIRDFLMRPGYSDRNYWFALDTYFGNDLKEPTLFISTIAAIKEEELFEKFRYAILNRLVPYQSLIELTAPKPAPEERKSIDEHKKNAEKAPKGFVEYLKIIEFFEWLETAERISWKEQQPDHVDSCATHP